MKKTYLLITVLGVLLCSPAFSAAMGGTSGNSAQAASAPDSGMQQAQQELNQAAAEFNQAEKQSANQQTKQTPLSEALSAPQAQTQDTGNQKDPRNQALQGSPATGYAGTWTDPATGDIMTSVIAPAPQPSQQNYPMIIEPQVAGGSWYGSAQNDWQQWPTSPDNPGYPPYGGQNYGNNGQNAPYPGWMPPYPGQPYPGFNPYPGMNYPPGWWAGQQSGRPPFNPNYRPLVPPQHQPNQPGNWPQQPGYNPGQPGFNPGQPPVANNPGSLWNPGAGFPGNSMQPAPGAPAVQPLPMRPSGNTWNNSTTRQHQGVFGGRGMF